MSHHDYTLPRPVADKALSILRTDEGVRRFAYDDKTGKEVYAPVGTLTIGVGVNLAQGLDDESVDWLERHSLYREWRDLTHAADVYEHGFVTALLPDGAQLALALMAFQLGAEGVMEFHEMLHAIRNHDWKRAAIEALDSEWGRKQTPKRAREVAEIFRGIDEGLYEEVT